jgi:hypothetical protein
MGFKFNPFTGNLDLVDTTTAAGSNTQVQFNDGGSLAGDSGLTFNKTTNALTVGASTVDGGQAKVFGDINLDDGGSFTTTVQCVTPTQNRTISFPDATGTVALVAGSSGQLVYNNAGAQAGATGSVVDSSGNVTIGGLTTLAGSPSANNTSGVLINGTWRTGASSNNPQLLLNPSGTTLSTTWSPSGTGIGVNAASGFVGRLIDLQTNGTSRMVVAGDGKVGLGTSAPQYLTHINSAKNTTSLFITTDSVSAGADYSQIGFGNNPSGNSIFAAIRHSYDNPGAGPAGALRFFTHTGSNLEERAVINSSGRVGIGTTSPGQILTVGNGGQTGAHFIRINGSNSDIYIGQSAGTVFGVPSGSGSFVVSDTTLPFGIGTSANQPLLFGTNGAERARIDSSGVIQVADAGNIAVGTTTGTKIGTATTQKLGFYNKTPVVQPTAVADATDAASVITQLNALLARMRDLGLIAT